MLSVKEYSLLWLNVALLASTDMLPRVASYDIISHRNLTAEGNEIARFKRQSTRCRSSQWQCRDGQCIAIDGKCDGSVDCKDNSDEILATCRDNKCPGYLFRCTYGACVDGDAKCNGRQDCADNSDELNRDCNPTSSPAMGTCGKEFTCNNGACVGQDRVCDGVSDCPDASDETVLQCGSLRCASYLFRCAYGACVDGGSDCNGRQDCADGSDESDELCNRMGSASSTSKPQVTTAPSKPNGSSGLCVLPPYPDNGKYTVQANPALGPGSSTDSVLLDYSCNKGYGLHGDTSVYCVSGMWATLPQCLRLCRPLVSTTVNFECKAADSTISLPCDQPLASGTRATPACKPSYYSSSPLKKLSCIDGSWEYTPTCTPECGTITPEGEILVIGGRVAKKGEFPWHVGIYQKSDAHNDQICGGSIVTSSLVVSAAHCFYRDSIGRVDASSFAVAAGKVYRPWNSPRETEYIVQKTNVADYYLPERYQGSVGNYQSDIALVVLSVRLVFSAFVRPVCIRLDATFDKYQLAAGNYGKVAGWGLTEEDGNASNVLKTVDLPVIQINKCIADSPPSFRPLITSDKICAGYRNGTALCKGDSGGGLVFPTTEAGIERYYLRGVVSTSPLNAAQTSCSANAYTAFTHLIQHEQWFNDIWSMHAA